MKYLKYSLVTLLVAGVFSVSAATRASSGYQHYAHTYGLGKSTFLISNIQKTEDNMQRIEGYSSSEITISTKILNSNRKYLCNFF